MSKTSLFIFIVILIVVFGASALRSRSLPGDSLPPAGDSQSAAPVDSSAFSPYSIASMQKASYDATLTVVRQVRSTPKFSSQVVSYYSDGLLLYALHNVPAGDPPAGGWPVVIVNHGHIPPAQYSVTDSYINTSAFYASSGFMVFKPDYRGHDDSAGEADSVTSRISYAADVLHLLSAVRKLPDINPDRIYMYGHSMGGDVSLRVLEICSSCVRAASLWAPAVTTFPESFTYFTRKLSSAGPADRTRYEKRLADLKAAFTQEQYTQVSTFDNAGLISVPVLIHHGTSDESVPYSWGTQLHDQLKSRGVDVQLYSYQGANHDITSHWSTALNRDIEFFRSLD